MNVVVIGFKGSGKSTVGPLLAEQIGFSFDDLDRRLQEATSLELGEEVDVREVFRRLGDARFREIERRLLAEALEEDRLVLALGGGAAIDPAAPDLVRGSCVVYLRVPEEDLVQRIRRRGWPAYLDGEADPEAALRRLLGERLPRYEEMADLVIDTSDRITADEGAEMASKRVMEWMKSRE